MQHRAPAWQTRWLSDAGDARADEDPGGAAEEREEDRAEPHRGASPEVRKETSDGPADERAETDHPTFHGSGIGRPAVVLEHPFAARFPGVMGRAIAVVGIFAALALPALATASKGAAACSIHGLTVSSVRVVGLSARGLSCSAARGVAVKIVRELGRGQPISVTGDEGFSMSQSTCTGCKTTTSVSIQYPRGTLTISIRGGSGSNSTTVPLPSAGPTTVF
jgi:hypothetical protein